MKENERCCFSRTYSAIEGLQPAYTLFYCAENGPQGVLLELRREQAGQTRSEKALCPGGSYAHLERAMRYLYENGVGQEHWLEALTDLGVQCAPPPAAPEGAFCGFCQI